MIIANKEITIYPARDASSPLVILNSFGDECEAVHEELRKMKTADFTLASIKITDWNSDLSPWAIPSVYKNDEPFTSRTFCSPTATKAKASSAIICSVSRTAALTGYQQ